MLKVTLKNGNEYELLEDTTVYPSGSPNARSRMEIHMGEDAMTTAEFEAAFMDEAATAKIRLTKLTEGVCYPVQAEVGSSGGYSWVRIFVAGVQRYAAVLADRCRLVTLSPGDAFAACVAQGGDAAGQRAQRDGRQAGAYAQCTEASGTAPGV